MKYIMFAIIILFLVACAEKPQCWIDDVEVPCDELENSNFEMPIKTTTNELKTLPNNYIEECTTGTFESNDANYKLIRITERMGTCFVYMYEPGAILKSENPNGWAAQTGSFGRVCTYKNGESQGCSELTTKTDW